MPAHERHRSSGKQELEQQESTPCHPTCVRRLDGKASQSYQLRAEVGQPAVGPKPAPEELIVIVLLPGWAGLGSRAELPVWGGAFRLAGVPPHRNGGRRFLHTVASLTGRDRESVRFYGWWR
jgi:hypothetical protein